MLECSVFLTSCGVFDGGERMTWCRKFAPAVGPTVFRAPFMPPGPHVAALSLPCSGSVVRVLLSFSVYSTNSSFKS